MMNNIDDARRQIKRAGREMVQHGLTWGSAGNISLRTAPDRCLISASGSYLGRLALEELVETPFSGGPSGLPRPSKELPMHAAVYRARPEIQAVLHGAPFYATLAACFNLKLPHNSFVEAMYYLERVARVPYHHPGSQELADAVAAQAGRANVLLLENHGVLVYDTNLAEALMALRTLEVVSRMAVEGRSARLTPQPVPKQVVADFLSRSGYRAPRRWPDAPAE
jgi:3-dehydro-4-phosphotetronate decarboxylase